MMAEESEVEDWLLWVFKDNLSYKRLYLKQTRPLHNLLLFSWSPGIFSYRKQQQQQEKKHFTKCKGFMVRIWQ